MQYIYTEQSMNYAHDSRFAFFIVSNHSMLHACSRSYNYTSVSETALKNMVNSLAPGKFELNFRHVIFKQISMIDGRGISCEIALI